MKKLFAALVLGLMAAAPASAKWYEASSEHFVIYADDSEKDILEFAQNLEKYHSAMSVVTGREIATPSPSNRVVIFVAGGQSDIRELSRGSSNVAGFYIPRAGGSRAFVQDIQNKKGYPSFSTVVLLHEYAHHFLISSSRFAMPLWLSEGAAEFFAASSFNSDGSMQVGRPALHRSAELAYADDVSALELLDSEEYEKKKGKRGDAFYGKSWALYHMMIFDEARKGQLNNYWQLLSTGSSSIDAAREAFGDIEALDKDLTRYLKQRRMFNLRLKPEWLPEKPIALRELPEGEAKMMDVRMVSQRGVTREEALELVVKAREIAAKYPGDAGVQVALAEAEFDAGNSEAAVIAADAAIALDPARPNAYVQKGYAQFRMAEDAEDKNAAYGEAMKTFSALNKIENDHPVPLIYYYRSFIMRGREPNETARHALEWAAELAPFDQGLAMNAALMQAREGKIALAKVGLSPVANNPHGGSLATTAKTYLALLGEAEEGKPWHPKAAIETVLEAIEVVVPGDEGEE
ncbi:MAG: DUF1570 domain-containing protein [Qipengyuania vulgaris]